MSMTRAILLPALLAIPVLSRAEPPKPNAPDAETAAVIQALGVAISHFMDDEDAPSAPNEAEWKAAFEAAQAKSKTLKKECAWSKTEQAKKANPEALKVLVSLCSAKDFNEHRELVREMARVTNRKDARLHLNKVARALHRLKNDTDNRSDACLGRVENLFQSALPTTTETCSPRVNEGDQPMLCTEQAGDDIGKPCWSGPYLKDEGDLLDPWKTRVRVSVTQVSEYLIKVKAVSAGPDRKWETSDDIVEEK